MRILNTSLRLPLQSKDDCHNARSIITRIADITELAIWKDESIMGDENKYEDCRDFVDLLFDSLDNSPPF